MEDSSLPEKTTLFNDKSSKPREYMIVSGYLEVIERISKGDIDRGLENMFDVMWMMFFGDKDRLKHKDPLLDKDFNECYILANSERSDDHKEIQDGRLRKRILEKVRLLSNLIDAEGIYTANSYAQREHWYKEGKDILDNR